MPCHRPTHARKAHIAGRFIASAALLNSCGSGQRLVSWLELDRCFFILSTGLSPAIIIMGKHILRRNPIPIIFGILLFQLVAGCGDRHGEILDTISSYTSLLAEGYRTLNMSKLATIAMPEQAKRAYHHMAALGEGLVAMDAELLQSDYVGIVRPADNFAEATVRETWRYRYRNLRTDDNGEYFTVRYTVRYFLVRPERNWRIDHIAVLDGDRTLGEDKLPFVQRPEGARPPWENHSNTQADQ